MKTTLQYSDDEINEAYRAMNAEQIHGALFDFWQDLGKVLNHPERFGLENEQFSDGQEKVLREILEKAGERLLKLESA